jgi:hypothetical protein
MGVKIIVRKVKILQGVSGFSTFFLGGRPGKPEPARDIWQEVLTGGAE